MIDAIVPLARHDAVSIPIRMNAVRMFLASYMPCREIVIISLNPLPFLMA